MKVLLTTIIAICTFTLTCSAQWTRTAPNIYPTVITDNVGIGTASPNANLAVVGASAANAGGHQGILEITTGTGLNTDEALEFGILDDSYAWIQAIKAGTAYRNLLLSPKGGNIGIRTTAPTAPLDIKTAGGFSRALRIGPDNTTQGDGGYIEFATSSNDGYGPQIGAMRGPGTTGAGDLVINTGNNAQQERLRVTNSGKVGIGTDSPDQALTVNGQVHSTSVVVTSPLLPPDYVFNTDYSLRPLADVKTYVDKNHHLPEVPSAADFTKNGQNLGEMNMLLLKKVEELTLYMIEKDKQIKALQGQQAEIDQLKKEIAELKQTKK